MFSQLAEPFKLTYDGVTMTKRREIAVKFPTYQLKIKANVYPLILKSLLTSPNKSFRYKVMPSVLSNTGQKCI